MNTYDFAMRSLGVKTHPMRALLPVQFVCFFFVRDSMYAKRAYAVAIPFVCPSVRHTGGSVKNGWS